MRRAIVRVSVAMAILTVISALALAQMQTAPSTQAAPMAQTEPMTQTAPGTQAAPMNQTSPTTQTMPTRVTVPAGTRILIRMNDAVDASKQPVGTRFTATLEANLQAGDEVVAPRGATVHGQLTNAQRAGRMAGGGALTLELTDIIINGTAYPLMTSNYEVRSEGRGGTTARRTTGGAGLGALIGGIAGGGSGAAIGAVSGGALGAGTTAAGSGQQVSVPSESLLEFRLEQPVTLPATGGNQ